jgi:hypothetical protein
MDQMMKNLFAREIEDSSVFVQQQIRLTQKALIDLQERIKNLQETADALVKQRICNDTESHDFECGDLSLMGSRFEDVCKHCGFVNRV